MEMNNLKISNNQVNSGEDHKRVEDALRSYSVFIRCSKCDYSGLTSVERSCSLGAICW